MENVVNLEQLNYRDEMIKEYIDQHSGGGGGNSDYIPSRLTLTRQASNISPSGEDKQYIYLGVPEGTDLTGVTLKYMRSSTVKQRNQREHISGYKNKWRGLHEIWTIPQKDKIPLIDMVFENEVSFSKAGYEYRKLLFVYEGEEHETLEFINGDYSTEYKNGKGRDITFGQIMRHKCGGIVLVKNDKYVSGHLRFHTVNSDYLGSWRLSLN